MNKYRRLRKLRTAVQLLKNEGYKVTYYQLKKLYEDWIIKGIKIGDVIYLYYDELLKFMKEN